MRDVINFIANPPEGSDDKLREEYKAEFETWPYAVVEGEKYIVNGEVDTMVREIPTDRPLKIGVTSGASTPDAYVQDALERLVLLKAAISPAA